MNFGAKQFLKLLNHYYEMGKKLKKKKPTEKIEDKSKPVLDFETQRKYYQELTAVELQIIQHINNPEKQKELIAEKKAILKKMGRDE